MIDNKKNKYNINTMLITWIGETNLIEPDMKEKLTQRYGDEIAQFWYFFLVVYKLHIMLLKYWIC